MDLLNVTIGVLGSSWSGQVSRELADALLELRARATREADARALEDNRARRAQKAAEVHERGLVLAERGHGGAALAALAQAEELGHPASAGAARALRNHLEAAEAERVASEPPAAPAPVARPKAQDGRRGRAKA
jgi:hypothetical protein